MQIGLTGSNWKSLQPPQIAQTTLSASKIPTGYGTYGPRQAEYVAQLMRYDVETGQCHEAFDHCLWDEAMHELWHLDQVEQAYHQAAANGMSVQFKDVRQIEGSTLWTLLAMTDEDDVPGAIEWRGPSSQHGPLSMLNDQDTTQFVSSMNGDCSFAMETLTKAFPAPSMVIKFSSYGHFGRFQGKRSLSVRLEELSLWQQLVKNQWSDFESSDSILVHFVVPQPFDEEFELHVIARTACNPDQHHFILVDKVEEPPQDLMNRQVAELSNQPNGYEILLAMEIDLNTVTDRTILKNGNIVWPHYHRPPVRDGQYWKILVEESTDESTLFQTTLAHDRPHESSCPSCEVNSFHPHVFDRWCDVWSDLHNEDAGDLSFLMQRPTASDSLDDGEDYHIFYRDTGHTNLYITDHDAADFGTIVENHMQLPAEGPSSIRTFHMVLHPPPLDSTNYNVHILEFREDADHRLMNDDVLCLFQITFENPERRADAKDKFRVMWTPKVATRDRILFHLRAIDPCRTRVCTLSVNNAVWSQLDTTLRHFKDGDFIYLHIAVAPGSSVIATRCDFQGYEATERARRIFTDSTTSEEEGEHTPTPTTVRSRSRSPTRSQREPEREPGNSPDDDEHSSLVQLHSSPSTIAHSIEFEIEESGRPSFYATCLLSPEDPLQAWTVVSHGLLRVHQGTRSVEIEEMEETVLYPTSCETTFHFPKPR